MLKQEDRKKPNLENHVCPILKPNTLAPGFSTKSGHGLKTNKSLFSSLSHQQPPGRQGLYLPTWPSEQVSFLIHLFTV